jgi:outer membrane protein assembly factor BamB
MKTFRSFLLVLMTLRSLRVSLVAVAVLSSQSVLRADDWPQILGIHRNGIANNERLLKEWPKGKPETAWQFEIGEGFGGPIVVGESVVIHHRVGDENIVDLLSLTDGKRQWQAKFPAEYQGTINPDGGPRATPLVHEQSVIVYSAEGTMVCLNLADGAKVWSRDLVTELKGDLGYFGAGSSPVAWKDRVIVNVGGKKGGVIALSLKDGSMVWTILNEQASYSAPALARIQQEERIIMVTRLNALVINPESGQVVAKTEFGQRGPTVNAATPLVVDGQIFLSASYGIGAKLLKLNSDALEEVWANDSSLSSQFTTAVYNAGYLFGTDGREDAGGASLRCVDWKNGKVMWEADSPLAHVVLAGDQIAALSITGQLSIFPADPKGYQPTVSAQIADGETRALPALADGRLLFRTNAVRGNAKLTALVIGEKTANADK